MNKQPFYIGQEVVTTKLYSEGGGLPATIEEVHPPSHCPVCGHITATIKINIRHNYLCEKCVAPIERTRITYVVKEVEVDAEIREKAKETILETTQTN